MIGLIIVTHSGLAEGLVRSAEMIAGKIDCCDTIEVRPEDLPDDVISRVSAAVKRYSDDGAIIMTDLFGGTPSNMAMSFLEEGKIEVVTGVNLPMVIEFCSKRSNLGVASLAAEIQGCGVESIIVAGALLK